MKLINLHTHTSPEQTAKKVEIWNYDFNSKNHATNYSIGIHPWFIDTAKIENQLQQITNHLAKKNCLALGECGLDKNISIPFTTQKAVFEQQLFLNNPFKKPVIVHCVKSFQEIIKIRKQFNFPFIIHGFNKKIALAEQLLAHNFYLSFGSALLYKESLQAIFKQIPLNSVFLETDNKKVDISAIYKKAADLKNIKLETLILSLNNNFKNVFNE